MIMGSWDVILHFVESRTGILQIDLSDPLNCATIAMTLVMMSLIQYDLKN